MNAERTLVRIRERPFLDVLDLALLVLRRRPRPLVLAAAAGVAPFAALNGRLLMRPGWGFERWALLLFLEAPWATLPLTVVLGGLLFGESPRPVAVAGRIARALPSLVLVHLLLRTLLAGTLVFSVLVPARFWCGGEVILLERLRGVGAVRRCWQLSGDRGGEFFMRWLAQVAFGLAFALCFATGGRAILATVLGGELTWERPALGASEGLLLQLGTWIAIAFFGVARFLLYIDERTRAEGWELRNRLQELGRAVEEGRA